MTQISIRWPWEIAPTDDPPDVAVVIDVLAATTNIASFLARGAHQVLLVNSETLRPLSARIPDAVIAGESMDLSLSGLFHISNGPAGIRQYNVEGKTIFFLSHNGTRIVEAAFAASAPRVITASFANLQSVTQWLRRQSFRSIWIMPSGERSLPESLPDQKSQEDWYCAQLLRSALLSQPIHLSSALARSEQFIRQRYPLWDEKEPDIRTILEANCYTVVPHCQPEPVGWIRVVDVFQPEGSST